MIHEHRGGTLLTQCDRDINTLHGPTVVGWNDGHRVTCPECLAAQERAALWEAAFRADATKQRAAQR